MKALLIVDVQNDFLPGGALPAPEGNNIIPKINRIMDQFDVVIASRDWHPQDSIHFERWPPHCVRNTKGAAFPEKLDAGKIQQEFLKGTEGRDDGYSAFEASNADLDDYLKHEDVHQLYLVGLTTEYCVKSSALDALKSGYNTFVIADATAGVKASPGDEERAYQEMQEAGVKIINTKDLVPEKS
jgi:nicotinamidase/pyrazinamidase